MRVVLILISALTLFAPAIGLIAEPAAPATKPAPKLAVGDLVIVTIDDLVGPNIQTIKTTRVNKDGHISLPLVGLVKAEGLTEPELETSIVDVFAKAKIMASMLVKVERDAAGTTRPALSTDDKQIEQNAGK